jgi:hypothetical protein
MTSNLLRTLLPLFVVSLLVACSNPGSGESTGAAASNSSSNTGTNTGTGADPGATTGNSLAANAKIIFLHHSTGGVIWGGGMASWVSAYNAAHAKSYQVVERAFPASSPYGWNNYPYDYWNIWVQHAGNQAYLNEPTLEMLTAGYQVIVWKHCFPVSDIDADTGLASISSATRTLGNYKLQYAALKAKMRSFPNTRFIVWTGSAEIQSETDPASAARAQEFAAWVKNAWDEPGDNIFVWDFRQLETAGGLYLLPQYSAGDSHPNATLANMIAPWFGQRIVDVIEGRGDSGSITGH